MAKANPISYARRTTDDETDLYRGLRELGLVDSAITYDALEGSVATLVAVRQSAGGGRPGNG